MYTWEEGKVYAGVDGKPAVIDDVVLSFDKNGEPELTVFATFASVLNNPDDPETGYSNIDVTPQGLKFWLGGHTKSEDNIRQRREISLGNLSKILGEKLEDDEDTVLKFAEDYKGKDSLRKKLIGKGLMAIGKPFKEKVWLNVWFRYEKPKQVSFDEIAKKFKERRAAASAAKM